MHTSSLVAYHITSFMLYESSYTDVRPSVRIDNRAPIVFVNTDRINFIFGRQEFHMS